MALCAITRLPSVDHAVLNRGVVTPSRLNIFLFRGNLAPTLSPCPSLSSRFNGLGFSRANLSTSPRRAHSQQDHVSRDEFLRDALPGPAIAAHPAKLWVTREERRAKYRSRTPTPPAAAPRLVRGSGLHKTVERAVSRGLLPKITAKQNGPQWTVAISLDKLALFVERHADTRAAAETAAASHFGSLLSSSDAFLSYPPTGITLQNAYNILQNYCAIWGNPTPQLSESSHPDTGHTVQFHSAGKPLTESASSATRGAAIAICKLAAALKIISGHPKFWPAGLENPFQPSIFVGDDLVNVLHQVAANAREILDSSADARGQAEDEVRGSYLDDCLAVLPVSPSIARMLAIGAITGGTDAAIILAALHSPSVMDTMSKPPAKLTSAVDGDHLGYVTAFAKLRNLVQPVAAEQEKDRRAKSTEIKDSGNKLNGAAASTVPRATHPIHDPLKQHYPHTIRSIVAAAQEIEESLKAAGLVKPHGSGQDLYKNLPGTDLKVKIVPYGDNQISGSLHTARKSLSLALGDNIAIYGYETLISKTATLHMGLQRMQHASITYPAALRARLARIGPLVIFSGKTESRDGVDSNVQHLTPISALHAALVSRKLAATNTPDHGNEGSTTLDYVELLVNDWLPILIQSDVKGLSHSQACALILETRELLHRAIDKALVDFFKYGWKNRTVRHMLDGLPVTHGNMCKKENETDRESGAQSLLAITYGLISRWF